MKKMQIMLAVLLCFSISANADFLFFKKKKKAPAKTEIAPPKVEPKGPKPFAQVITKGAKSVKGFIVVHKVDNKYFFEIPDSILGRDLLIVNRISKSAADSRKGTLGYAGDEINEDMIRFEKGPNDKIFLKTVSYSERSSDSLGMYRNVLNSNIQPIMSAFDIKAYKKDSIRKTQSPVIEVTDFVSSDNMVLNFHESIKKSLGLGNYLADRSYIDTIRTYPENLEIRTVKTYSQKPQNPADAMGAPFTFELNSSVVLLPKVPMKPRYFDPRVAYFATGYIDFDKNPQGVETVRMATRWRLEPKDGDLEKYKRGELVEPKKPIVFYIDPTTPKKWVPYLIQGVNDWQKAFEKAGFKNAIYALEAPKDSSWSLDDARHSAIVYKPSNVANASGPHVHDPRSGEIIETHINWYHNVMELLHDWYFVQTAAVDARARKVQFDDELMGQLIRFVSSHEVGHTLGLRHNFGSSATVPVEKLRDKKWVEENGHTPSIMDYARFNYVAQPEDNITEAGLFPRIGMYDNWSIEWGYRYYPQFATAQDEVPYLDSLVVSKLNSDKRYTFGTETDSNDPRNQSEDLGDNAMLASKYGIKNLQRIIPNIMTWTVEPNKDYMQSAKMYSQIVSQFNRYMGHVTKNIAGIYNTPKKSDQPGSVVEFVPASIQKEALVFLNEQLFNTPTWLIDKNLISKAQVDPVSTIGNIQRNVISRLLSRYTFDKMIQNETLNGNNAFTVVQMLDMLKSNVWAGTPKDTYRRNLQKFYVDALISMIQSSPSPLTVSRSLSDASGLARMHLMQLRSQIASQAISSTGITKAHFIDLQAQIDTALDTKK